MAKITIAIEDAPQSATYEVMGDMPATLEEAEAGTNAQMLAWNLLKLLDHLLKAAAVGLPKH
ncbi:hypothetical protein [Neisseria bacilliformis]|uniref:hypothetical protein n=1 Tax=Neisseria bacilliformis TaxID=267212 RepID=UPI00066623E5|nr:hypothetical protein [Neisseria bacilliformis]